MDLTFADAVRSTLIVTGVSVMIIFAWRMIREWKWMDLPERLLCAGSFSAMLALAGRGYVAMQLNEPLVWPIIFQAIALVFFVGYLTAPGRRK
jgi:hypothetical protein